VPECDLVVDSALSILDRVGIRMGDARFVDALEQEGARVDRETGVVRLSEETVRKALRRLPSRLVMAGETPDLDVVLDRHSLTRFNTGGCYARTIDTQTGQLRSSSLQDLRDGTTVMDATPELDVIWSFATANDVPLELRERVEYYTLLTHTAKPIVFVDCPSEVDTMKQIADIISDGLDGFRRRPRISILCSAHSPLEFNAHLLGVACDLAALGMPVWAYSLPIAGATGPVTIAGMLALVWAEILGQVVAIQAVAPGAAILACCGPAILDMRTTAFSMGCLENTIMGVASVEIGHRLELPVLVPGLATDAKHPGIQAGYEKGLKALPAALAGADIIGGGFGALDSSNSFYLPMVVIDAEIAAMIKRLVSETPINPETVMLDVIERVGIGGNFLKEKVTRQRVRAGEHYMPQIASRVSFEQWRAAGRSEVDVARDRVEQILHEQEGKEPYLSDEQRTALGEVCRVGLLTERL
jgi:trimethylamine--corrinoid protein Co-methyltransferase